MRGTYATRLRCVGAAHSRQSTTDERVSSSGLGARRMRTTPLDRHWRWCQQVRRAHRQAPEAEERDALTGGEALSDETGGIILTTHYPSLNGTKFTFKRVVYVTIAPHPLLGNARGFGGTDPFSTRVHETNAIFGSQIWTRCRCDFRRRLLRIRCQLRRYVLFAQRASPN